MPVENIEVHISHDKVHAADLADVESTKGKIDTFSKEIKISGDYP